MVVFGVIGGLHFYFWARLVRDTQVPAPYRVWAMAACAALAVSLPASFLVMRRLSPTWSRVLAWPIYTWMGIMFLLAVSLAAADVVRLLVHAWTRVLGPAPLDPARRLLLSRALGGCAGAGAGLLGAVAVRSARSPATIKEVKVRLDGLAAGSAGATIVQLTDMHVGPTLGRAFVEDIVSRTNDLRPDVIAITGDLVDGSVASLRDAVAPLRDLRARHGVFFVTGNHEYYSGAHAWVRELARMGMIVLRNERVAIGGFDLAGVDDWGARGYGGGHGSDVAKALDDRDPARPVVLLAHQPRTVVEAAAHGVSLQLSGHTHGGQIWPWGYAVKLQQPYVVGLHQHGGTQIYVSAGTGYWGPPMRLGAPSEITRITLLAGEDEPPPARPT